MRVNGFAALLLASALFVPATASAQERPDVFVVSQRGMLGIRTSPVPAGDWNARQRVVTDVVEDSPAQKAGVMKGDTLLSINGLAASRQVMDLPFQPGDSVVLRVRRYGRERNLTVVATERTEDFAYRVAFPESIGNAVTIMMDRLRAHVDTLRFPHVQVRRFGNDSSFSIVVVGDDTTRIRTLRHGWNVPFDSMRSFLHDSMFTGFRIGAAFPDSAWFGAHFDSMPPFGFSVYSDSAHMVSPFEMFSYTTSIGMRAVAGAELTQLNPGLANYFGATDGVLVLNAHEGTPAARAGLRAGDVIVRAGDVDVTSIAELRRAIQRARGDNVTLRVLRGGRHVDISLGRE